MSCETQLVTDASIGEVMKVLNDKYGIVHHGVEYELNGACSGFVTIDSKDKYKQRRVFIYQCENAEHIGKKKIHPYRTLILSLGYGGNSVQILTDVGNVVGGYLKANDCDTESWVTLKKKKEVVK